jgi:hypothetical protein
MLGHGAKLGRKKEAAVAALLSHRNLEEAARATGVVPNTLLRWMKDPEFDAAYRAAKRAAFGQAVALLQQGASAAATTLLKTMIEPNTPASVRVRGCRMRAQSCDEGHFRSRTSRRACRSWSGPHKNRSRAGRDDEIDGQSEVPGETDVAVGNGFPAGAEAATN